jgi:AcrR family transcriptional regulator
MGAILPGALTADGIDPIFHLPLKRQSGDIPSMTTDEATPAKRRGRRSGGADTRAALVQAARAVFAEQGYQGATVRGIAARAGVDAAMVNHWFGGKQGLFAAVIELPFDPTDIIEHVLAGDLDTLAERIVRTFVGLWDTHEGRFATVMLSVASQDMAARMMADFFAGALFGRIAQHAGGDHPDMRAALCGTQIAGLGVVRYVLKLEPVASADVDTLVRMVGPTIQRYLTGEL